MRKETLEENKKYDCETSRNKRIRFPNGLIINNKNVYLYVDFLKKMGLERF